MGSSPKVMHSGKLQARKTSFLSILFDSVVIVMSFSVSLFLRRQFPNYLMEPWKFLLLLPYVVLLRTLVMSFFEHYRISSLSLQLHDIWSLFIHNVIPSVFFLLFRLFSPIRMLRIPFSMILTEYFFTVCGMIIVRYLVLKLGKEKRLLSSAQRRKQAVILTSSTGDLKGLDLEDISARHFLEVTGILTGDAMEWNTDYSGIRILGGFRLFEELAMSNDRLQVAVIFGWIEADSRWDLMRISHKWGIDLRRYTEDRILEIGLVDLFSRNPDDFSTVPEEITEYLDGKTIAVRGSESIISQSMALGRSEAEGNPVLLASEFSSSTEVLERLSPEIYIDLKCQSLVNRGYIDENLYRSFFNELTDMDGNFENFPFLQRYIAVVPIPRKSCPGIDKATSVSKNISILFTEGVLQNVPGSLPLDTFALWDTPQSIAGFIFRVCNLSRYGHRLFYACSEHARRIEDLIPFSKFPTLQTGVKEAIDSPTASVRTQLFSRPLKATSFYGLYTLGQEIHRSGDPHI